VSLGFTQCVFAELRLHAAVVSAAKVMCCVQCSLAIIVIIEYDVYVSLYEISPIFVFSFCMFMFLYCVCI